ncbi:MAG: hypothetical protein M3198_05015 [Actinomycetota bacterium]|nr:hypothetical protein [Actinomycetota bacterium]
MPDVIEPDDRQVGDRATGIGAGGEDADKVAEGDADKAQRAAAQILKESEERTFDNATRDIEDESVPRRSSEETA